MSVTVTGRPRGSTPMGNASNRLTVPLTARGQGTGLALDMALSATHKTSRPSCTSESPSGHTADNGSAQACGQPVTAVDDGPGGDTGG